MATLKWFRDPDSTDRYASWFYGDPTAEEATREAVATVKPEWGPTRGTGVGAPSHWEVWVNGQRLADQVGGVRAGRTVAEAALAEATRRQAMDIALDAALTLGAKQAHLRTALHAAGLTAPEGVVLDARWVASSGDWYVHMAAGWYWWDTRAAQWKACPLGPIV